jgi:hypothetical protein
VQSHPLSSDCASDAQSGLRGFMPTAGQQDGRDVDLLSMHADAAAGGDENVQEARDEVVERQAWKYRPNGPS